MVLIAPHQKCRTRPKTGSGSRQNAGDRHNADRARETVSSKPENPSWQAEIGTDSAGKLSQIATEVDAGAWQLFDV